MSEMAIEIIRYGIRHWAVFIDGKLLCVTVYKKGALAVRDALLRMGCKSEWAQDTDPLPRTGIENPSVMEPSSVGLGPGCFRLTTYEVGRKSARHPVIGLNPS
jgi:hypothetical protein